MKKNILSKIFLFYFRTVCFPLFRFFSSRPKELFVFYKLTQCMLEVLAFFVKKAYDIFAKINGYPFSSFVQAAGARL